VALGVSLFSEVERWVFYSLSQPDQRGFAPRLSGIDSLLKAISLVAVSQIHRKVSNDANIYHDHDDLGDCKVFGQPIRL
jgi:hypothetical protein